MNRLPGWRYRVLNGRIRKRAINKPRRERLQVRNALARLRYRYKEVVPFWNPYHRGFHDDLDGGVQWLDFCFLMPNGRMAVILFDARTGKRGPKPYEYRYIATKETFLHERKTPCLVLRRTLTVQEYELLIYRFSRSESRKDSHA